MKRGKSKVDSKNVDTKLSVKKQGAGRTKPTKNVKGGKVPNKPKRRASSFFVFMEEFRKQYEENHPDNKSAILVGKAGGVKWKSLSDAEKTPYVAGAEKRKIEYNKNMQAYNKRLVEGLNAAEEEESDKSRSEVHDDDKEDDESGEEDDDVE